MKTYFTHRKLVACLCGLTGAMYCTLLPMQTNTDCRPAERHCGMSYTVHGSPDQVYQLPIDYFTD